jgi:two-component system NtrC family sensor kinase
MVQTPRNGEKKQHYALLRRKILFSIIIVPFVPFILVVLTGSYYFTSSLKTKTIHKMMRIVDDHCHMIESFLSERQGDLQFIVGEYTFEELSNANTLARVFDNLQNCSRAFIDLGVFNQRGLHVAYQGPHTFLVGKQYEEEEWFQEVMQRRYYVSDVFLGYRQIPHFIIAIARNTDGRSWVLRATIDTYLFNETVENIRIGKTGEAYILNENGRFQTQRRSGGRLMETDPDWTEYLAPHSGIRTFVARDASGESYLYATTWLKDRSWLLVVRQQEADAFKALRSATYLEILIATLGATAIVTMAFYVTGRLIRRLEQMDAEKSHLTNQLIVAGRLAELGEMSAGFAHEINNPLQIIRAEQTLIETILSDLEQRGEVKKSEDLEQLHDSVQQIRFEVDRCSQITQGILHFGRQEKPVSRQCDLRAFLPGVIELVERKASVISIVIKQEISAEVPAISADAGQLEQVLLNLFNNAIDAILGRHGAEGGEMRVGARQGTNGLVELTVSDNGCGISPGNMEKIFTPFFTTKPVGKGTGLGLSICFGIVDSMGGTIEVSSAEGKGTTFTVRLPAAG